MSTSQSISSWEASSPGVFLTISSTQLEWGYCNLPCTSPPYLPDYMEKALETGQCWTIFTTLHTSLHKVSSNHIQGMRLRKHSRKYPGPWFWVYNLMGEIPICTLHYTGTHTKMNSSEKAIKRMRVQRALRKTYLLYLGNNDRITFILFGKN